jgi:MarR family transcriptional regulator, organic hydroperoxide resistance regulator
MDETRIVMLIARIHKKADAFIMAELARHGMEGLVPSHGDILFMLFTRGSLPMNEIAGLIHRKKPTVTVLVDKLIELGFVEKLPDPEDGRVNLIALTGKGRRMKKGLMAISGRLLDRVYDRIGKEDRERLCVLLERICNNL